MKISIVGAGALGSHVTMGIRNCEANVSVIDFDRVERKNTASQLHAQNAVGKNKVVALQQLMQFLFAKKINAIPHKLTSDNDDQLLSGSDLVLDCLDNGEARRLVQNFAKRSQTPCLHGALSGGGQFGRVVWDEHFSIDDESVVGEATCENGDFLPFIMIVSSYMASSVLNFLQTGKKFGYQVTPTSAVRV